MTGKAFGTQMRFYHSPNVVWLNDLILKCVLCGVGKNLKKWRRYSLFCFGEEEKCERFPSVVLYERYPPNAVPVCHYTVELKHICLWRACIVWQLWRYFTRHRNILLAFEEGLFNTLGMLTFNQTFFILWLFYGDISTDVRLCVCSGREWVKQWVIYRMLIKKRLYYPAMAWEPSVRHIFGTNNSHLYSTVFL